MEKMTEQIATLLELLDDRVTKHEAANGTEAASVPGPEPVYLRKVMGTKGQQYHQDCIELGLEVMHVG